MDSTTQSEITGIESELSNINTELEATVSILKDYYKNIGCEKYTLDIESVISSIKNALHK